MKWMLMILVCHQYSAQCHWQRMAREFASEEQCIINALALPAAPEFRCQRAESIPLPRPRPKI
jgi:hypothetical protein